MVTEENEEVLLLHEFDLEIKDRKWTKNQVVDYLSRLDNGEAPKEDQPIKETFPDEQLFRVVTKLNMDTYIAREKRMLQLNELEEFRLQAYENANLYKEKTKN